MSVDVNVKNDAAKPKLRRGVSNQTKATASLKFHERDAAPNGLFVGHMYSGVVS